MDEGVLQTLTALCQPLNPYNHIINHNNNNSNNSNSTPNYNPSYSTSNFSNNDNFSKSEYQSSSKLGSYDDDSCCKSTATTTTTTTISIFSFLCPPPLFSPFLFLFHFSSFQTGKRELLQ